MERVTEEGGTPTFATQHHSDFASPAMPRWSFRANGVVDFRLTRTHQNLALKNYQTRHFSEAVSRVL
jgi:hypothetical protein